MTRRPRHRPSERDGQDPAPSRRRRDRASGPATRGAAIRGDRAHRLAGRPTRPTARGATAVRGLATSARPSALERRRSSIARRCTTRAMHDRAPADADSSRAARTRAPLVRQRRRGGRTRGSARAQPDGVELADLGRQVRARWRSACSNSDAGARCTTHSAGGLDGCARVRAPDATVTWTAGGDRATATAKTVVVPTPGRSTSSADVAVARRDRGGRRTARALHRRLRRPRRGVVAGSMSRRTQVLRRRARGGPRSPGAPSSRSAVP